MTSGTTPAKVERIELAPIPAELKTCFNRLVPAPKRGDMSRADVVRLIGDLKKSELAKSECGKRLIVFYEAQNV